jgi:hypothetical protein
VDLQWAPLYPRNNSRVPHISLVFREIPRISCTRVWTGRRVRLSFKERRMKFREATLLFRKSGMWDTATLALKLLVGGPGLAFETWVSPRNKRSRIQLKTYEIQSFFFLENEFFNPLPLALGPLPHGYGARRKNGNQERRSQP